MRVAWLRIAVIYRLSWWGGGVLLLGLCTAQAQELSPRAETVAVHGSIPMNVQEIEITYPQGSSPYVSLKQATPHELSSFRPSGNRFEILSTAKELLSFGSSHNAEWKD